MLYSLQQIRQVDLPVPVGMPLDAPPVYMVVAGVSERVADSRGTGAGYDPTLASYRVRE